MSPESKKERENMKEKTRKVAEWPRGSNTQLTGVSDRESKAKKKINTNSIRKTLQN
jgi:hypothetical protein